MDEDRKVEAGQGMNCRRIFWLGMHKILVQTELPRLRKLGYEVFNPPYLSSIQDQSACLDWDANQPTTLPAEVFKKLSSYNFFYNSISKEIADLLNTYFDAVVVTISTAWLMEILKCYKGTVIYRVYGQHYLLTQELTNQKLIHHIVSRDNFWFVPHAVEAVRDEDSWLRERELVVPYCLAEDVFTLTDTWAGVQPKRPEIAITCPNIKNSYFHAHYKFLQANFNEHYYKYYGVQLSRIDNPQVIGTLPRDVLLRRFQQSAGYLYTYSEERVCYLPPIEMMILGGPVLYLQGSLLDRYFNHDSPGRCVSVEEARMKSQWLIQEDKSFIDEVIASQKEVRARYTPEVVWPIFDRTFQNILNQKNHSPFWLVADKERLPKKKKRIYIFHHFPGYPIVSRNGTYSAYDGIPRVIRQVAMILASMPNIEIVMTARANQVAAMNGYFRNNPHKDRVRILCINPAEVVLNAEIDSEGGVNLRKYVWIKGMTLAKRLARAVIPSRYYPRINVMRAKLREYAELVRTYIGAMFDKDVWHIDFINKDENCLAVFVPHYYLFPDALQLKKKIMLYLPDYMPHFFHHTGEFSADEGVHTHTGKRLVQKAEKIFCNSNFTKSYLPDCRLKVPVSKIHVSYLPFLNFVLPRAHHLLPNADDRIYSKPYIFYPTRPHPNKNLSFLLRVFDRLVADGCDINLVLTTTLECDNKATKVFHSMKHKNRVIFLEAVSDDMLAHLYQKAAVLCFTSLAEGNFPPQIHEALKYDTPIVAGRLNFITERIPDHLSDAIIFCEPNSEDEFVSGCKLAIENRELVLQKQRQVLKAIESDNADIHFRHKVLEIFNLI